MNALQRLMKADMLRPAQCSSVINKCNERDKSVSLADGSANWKHSIKCAVSDCPDGWTFLRMLLLTDWHPRQHKSQPRACL
jgi:hypothetical protein